MIWYMISPWRWIARYVSEAIACNCRGMGDIHGRSALGDAVWANIRPDGVRESI